MAQAARRAGWQTPTGDAPGLASPRCGTPPRRRRRDDLRGRGGRFASVPLARRRLCRTPMPGVHRRWRHAGGGRGIACQGEDGGPVSGQPTIAGTRRAARHTSGQIAPDCPVPPAETVRRQLIPEPLRRAPRVDARPADARRLLLGAAARGSTAVPSALDVLPARETLGSFPFGAARWSLLKNFGP